jgi:hypothetical protein
MKPDERIDEAASAMIAAIADAEHRGRFAHPEAVRNAKPVSKSDLIAFMHKMRRLRRPRKASA